MKKNIYSTDCPAFMKKFREQFNTGHKRVRLF